VSPARLDRLRTTVSNPEIVIANKPKVIKSHTESISVVSRDTTAANATSTGNITREVVSTGESLRMRTAAGK